jgi:hypothetical protein
MRYHLSTLKREVQRLKGSSEAGNAPIVLNLCDGSIYTIRTKDMCGFGAAAIFDEGSAEHNAVNLVVEPKNKIVQLLTWILCKPTEVKGHAE